MRILMPPGGPGPGPGPNWRHSRPGSGLVHSFFHNLCTTMCSCVYVFCCCWLLEDCLMGQRSFPGPHYGYPEGPEPPPTPPPYIGPASQGPLGGLFGRQHQPGPQGPFGGLFGPQSQPGPVGYPGEPPPY